MYKAQMIASAVVHKDYVEGFAEIVKPEIAAICSGESGKIIRERINPNGSYSIRAIVTDPDFKLGPVSDAWIKALAERLTPYSSVTVSLYLKDMADGTEYWASGLFEYKEKGRSYYTIYVGEEENMVHIDSSEIIWG